MKLRSVVMSFKGLCTKNWASTVMDVDGINNPEKGILFGSITPLHVCNQKCPYCYVPDNHAVQACLDKTQWSKEQVDTMLGKIKQHPGTFEFQILGGEPLLWKNLEYFLQEAEKVPNIRRMYVTTNGKTSPKGRLTKVYPKSSEILISIHPTEIADVSNIIKNGKLYESMGYKVFYKIMCFQIKGIRAKVEKFIDQFEEAGLLDQVYTGYIQLNNQPYAEVIPVTWKPTRIKSLITYRYDNGLCLDEGELFSFSNTNRINRFTGWTCYQNMFHVFLNGDVYIGCRGAKTLNILKDDISSLHVLKTKCCNAACTTNCPIVQLKIKE